MSAPEILEQQRQPETVSQGLDTKLTKEVETILEEAERSRAESQSETGHWYYRIPCAGVRYYSFDAGEPGL